MSPNFPYTLLPRIVFELLDLWSKILFFRQCTRLCSIFELLEIPEVYCLAPKDYPGLPTLSSSVPCHTTHTACVVAGNLAGRNGKNVCAVHVILFAFFLHVLCLFDVQRFAHAPAAGSTSRAHILLGRPYDIPADTTPFPFGASIFHFTCRSDCRQMSPHFAGNVLESGLTLQASATTVCTACKGIGVQVNRISTIAKAVIPFLMRIFLATRRFGKYDKPPKPLAD